MVLSISEIFKKCNEAPDVVEALRQQTQAQERQVLKYAFDPAIKWLLPETDPPYKPCTYLDQHNELRRDVRKLYLYIEGGNPALKPVKREAMFISLLESIDPEDAKLILAVKNKKFPYPNITADVVKEAFPDIF